MIADADVRELINEQKAVLLELRDTLTAATDTLIGVGDEIREARKDGAARDARLDALLDAQRSILDSLGVHESRLNDQRVEIKALRAEQGAIQAAHSVTAAKVADLEGSQAETTARVAALEEGALAHPQRLTRRQFAAMVIASAVVAFVGVLAGAAWASG